MRRKLPTFLRDDEPERLLEATTNTRDRVLLMTLLMLGLRVSEGAKLKIEHIDFRRASLLVKEGKGQKDRILPIPKRLVGILRGWIGPRKKGYVFPSRCGGGRLTNRAIQRMLKRVAEAAGLDGALEPRRFHPHALRHVFATRLLRAGADIVEVQHLMGHSNIATTAIYLHADPERLRSAVDRVY